MFNWRVWFGIALVSISTVLYFLHYLIFRDAHHIFIYLLGDIAFLFFEVFLVVLFVEHLIEIREKKSLVKKMNMVIGAFFNEAGVSFIRDFSHCIKNINELNFCNLKNKNDFCFIKKYLKNFDMDIDVSRRDLLNILDFLVKKKNFLLMLLQNPNLLEHSRFTDLLWALLHLCEELELRKDLLKIDEVDFEHLAGDFRRAYKAILNEWIFYVEHLQTSYPFLFSLAVRNNPLNKDVDVEVK